MHGVKANGLYEWAEEIGGLFGVREWRRFQSGRCCAALQTSKFFKFALRQGTCLHLGPGQDDVN